MNELLTVNRFIYITGSMQEVTQIVETQLSDQLIVDCLRKANPSQVKRQLYRFEFPSCYAPDTWKRLKDTGKILVLPHFNIPVGNGHKRVGYMLEDLQVFDIRCIMLGYWDFLVEHPKWKDKVAHLTAKDIL